MRINEFKLVNPLDDVNNTITRLINHRGPCDRLSPENEIIMSDILLLQTDLTHPQISYDMTEVRINAYCPRCKRHGSGWIESNGWFSALTPERGVLLKEAMLEFNDRKNTNSKICDHHRLMMSSEVISKDIAYTIQEERTRNCAWFEKRKELSKRWWRPIGSDKRYHLIWCPDCFAMTCVDVGKMSFVIYDPSNMFSERNGWY